MCTLESLEETSDPLLKLSEVWGNSKQVQCVDLRDPQSEFESCLLSE